MCLSVRVCTDSCVLYSMCVCMGMYVCVCMGVYVYVWLCILQPLSAQGLRSNWREKTHIIEIENNCAGHSMVMTLGIERTGALGEFILRKFPQTVGALLW